MKIVFDARLLGRTGVGRYVEELLAELQQIDTADRYDVLLQEPYFSSWKPTHPNFHPVLAPFDSYTWGEQLGLPRLLHRLKPDVVHFPHFAVPILYRGPFVVTIHDLTLFTHRNIRGGAVSRLLHNYKYVAMRLAMRVAAKRSRAILTPTEYVKNGLINHFHLPAPKISVTLEGVSERLAAKAGSLPKGVKAPFIMYIGSYFPYKNIDRLVEAFSRTQARVDGTQLVLAGAADYFQRAVASRAEAAGKARGVAFTGRVSDEDLAALYENASLYVFPSLSEGFGLPGLEAMAHGTPVLASNATCLPEVYGDAAEYFDPLDTLDLAAKIDQLLRDEPRRLELSAAGREQVSHFSWARTARITEAVYKDAGRPRK